MDTLARQQGGWTSGHLGGKTSGQPSFRENLIQKADELAHLVYPLTYKFPQEEKYALGDQIRRAVVSVPTNLIEGVARGGEKEKRQFANFEELSKLLFSFLKVLKR